MTLSHFTPPLPPPSTRSGNLTDLSEETLIACDDSPEDHGCYGTDYGMDSAFAFAQENGGLCTEVSFPYTSADGTAPTCNASCDKVAASAPASVTDVDPNEDALQAAVAQQPVAVVIDASCPGWMQYSGGVWTEDCGTKLDHAVLVVGYGTDEASGTECERLGALTPRPRPAL